VAQNTWIVDYAPERNLSLVFGLVLGVSRASGAINFALTPTISTKSVLWAIWLGTILTLLSLLATFILVRLANSKPPTSSHNTIINDRHNLETLDNDTKQIQPVLMTISTPASNPDTSINTKTDDINPPASSAPIAISTHPIRAQEQLRVTGVDDGSSVVCRGCSFVLHELGVLKSVVVSFPVEAHVQFLICVFYHVGVLLLYQIASQFLQNSGPYHSERTASLLVAIPSFISIVATPAAGHLVDRYGQALWSIFASCLLLVLAHVLLIVFVIQSIPHPASYSSYNPGGIAVCIIALVLVGISYSVATASIWPLVPFILPTAQLATGYGCMSSVENLGLAVMSMVLIAIQDSPTLGIQESDNPWHYITPLIVLMATAITAGLLTLVQIHLDVSRHHGGLNKPANQRRSVNSTNFSSAVEASVSSSNRDNAGKKGGEGQLDPKHSSPIDNVY
jgi:hypothetical protein